MDFGSMAAGSLVPRGVHWGLALIVFAFVAIFARTASFGFVWDDVEAIRDNPIFDGPWHEGLAATQHDHLDPNLRRLSGVEMGHDSYRPLLYASYRADVALVGMSPRAMHVHNLVLAVLSIVLFFWVSSRWLAEPTLALIATGVFALHPAQVEAVAYVSARGDLLAGLMALAAVASALRYETSIRARRTGWLLFGALAFAGSLLSKEAYLGLPIAFAGVAFARGTLRAQRTTFAVWVVVLVVYLVVRLSLGGGAGGGLGPSALIALPGILLRYLLVAISPFDLSTERLYDPSFVVPGWLMVVVASMLFGLGLQRGMSRTAKTVVSGLWWMLVLLGPSAIVIVLAGVVADRYLYLPLGGFAVAVASLLGALYGSRLRVPAVATAGLLAATWVVTSVLQVGVWRDNRTLYEHAATATPESSMAHYRLGHALALEGRANESIALFSRALELDPNNVRAHNNLGVMHLRQRNYDEAAAAFERAIAESGQTHFRAWYNLGVARGNMGDRGAACAAVGRALDINPRYEAAADYRQDRCVEAD